MTLPTSAYASFGRGGRTGDLGSIGGRGTWGFREENGLIRMNDIINWKKRHERFRRQKSANK